MKLNLLNEPSYCLYSIDYNSLNNNYSAYPKITFWELITFSKFQDLLMFNKISICRDKENINTQIIKYLHHIGEMNKVKHINIADQLMRFTYFHEDLSYTNQSRNDLRCGFNKIIYIPVVNRFIEDIKEINPIDNDVRYVIEYKISIKPMMIKISCGNTDDYYIISGISIINSLEEIRFCLIKYYPLITDLVEKWVNWCYHENNYKIYTIIFGKIILYKDITILPSHRIKING